MENQYEKYLPIGSVVIMKGGKKRVMVVGYLAKTAEFGDKIFDYVGCLYPEGLVSSKLNLMFNHEDIERVYAIGYSDDEQKKFMGVLNRTSSELTKKTETTTNN